MKDSIESGRRTFKPPFLMLTILGIHVAAAGFFMMMSGCSSTKQASVEPPPAPILPPRPADESAVSTPMPRPGFRPPVAVEKAPESIDAAGASSYTIQKGDSLSKVAVRAGVSVREIQELNSIADPNKIRIGQKILLPAHAKSLPDVPVAAPAKSSTKASSKPSAPAKASGDTHTVQPGDTLGKLASRYGTSVAAFKSVNNLKSDTIRIGQKLAIPNGKGNEKAASSETKASAASAAPAAEVKTVAPAPEAAPAAAAPAVVDVPAAVDTVDAASSEADAEPPFPYTVKDGDTLDSIAIKFSARKDVIMRLNGLTSETISSGQKLLIPWQ